MTPNPLLTRCALSALLWLTLCSGCGHPEAEETEQAQRHLIRPDSSAPYLGIGYAEAKAMFFDTAGGTIRVWWALTGPHAPPAEDVMPANGTPDYVEMVAASADRVVDHASQNGWRLARGDGESMPNGGDTRFDIYLVNFGGGADGLVARNRCVPVPPVSQCEMHMLLENDFAGYPYPSVPEAIDVLVSHEYFHAIQSAYTADLEGWVLEGSATWFQEDFDPAQSDFERLVRAFPSEASRSLNSPSLGPADGFIYHTALFFHHLALKFGPPLIRHAFESMATEGLGMVEALEKHLVMDHGSSFEQAFLSFARWNAFTGSRTVAAQGYPQAAELSEATFERFDAPNGINWNVDVPPLATKYSVFSVQGPTTLWLAPVDGIPEQPAMMVLEGPEAFTLVTPEAPITLQDPGPSITLAMVHPAQTGRRAAQVRLRRAPGPGPDMGQGEDMGQADDMAKLPPDLGAPDMPTATEDDMAQEEDLSSGAAQDMGQNPDPEPPPVLRDLEGGSCAQTPAHSPLSSPLWLILVAVSLGRRRLKADQNVRKRPHCKTLLESLGLPQDRRDCILRSEHM